MHQKQLIAVGAILLATLFWGMTFTFIKIGVASLSPYNFLFWRFGAASLLLWIFGFKVIKKESRPSTYKAGFYLGFFLLGTVLFQSMGLQTISASTASFITGISVILVPFFVSCATRTRPRMKTVAAALVAFVGIGVISLSKGF